MMLVRRCLHSICFSIIGLVLLSASATAASLAISPIRVDVVAPGNSSNVTVTNPGKDPINVQVRIFRWGDVGGDDHHRETDDVVVTPPITTVAPGSSFTIRIIRQVNAPVRGEEAYRLVVDEIPDANRTRNIGVTVAVRYALPVFFLSTEATQPRLSWSIQLRSGKRYLVATNTGDKHVRVSALAIGNVVLARGLAGYVLGHGSRAWLLPGKTGAGPITADSDAGRINAVVTN